MSVPDNHSDEASPVLVGGDNRPVVLPMWLAQDILEILGHFNQGGQRSKTPCYAAQEQDLENDLRQLIGEVK